MLAECLNDLIDAGRAINKREDVLLRLARQPQVPHQDVTLKRRVDCRARHRNLLESRVQLLRVDKE